MTERNASEALINFIMDKFKLTEKEAIELIDLLHDFVYYKIEGHKQDHHNSDY